MKRSWPYGDGEKFWYSRTTPFLPNISHEYTKSRIF